MSEIKKRVISASLALILLAVLLYINGLFFRLVIFFLALVATYELNKAFKNKGFQPKNVLSFVFVGFFILTFLLAQYTNPLYQYYMTMIGLAVFISVVFAMFFIYVFKDRESIPDIMISLFAVLYIGFPASMIIILSDTAFLYLILLISFASDTCALFTGRAIGKHKLAPKISPNKTIEGSLGGVLGTVIILIISKYVYYTFLSLPILLALGLFGSVFAQLGDLTASMLKRYCEIKDFGKIMPGHGGILDRLDSIFFVTPLVFLLYILSLAPGIFQTLR